MTERQQGTKNWKYWSDMPPTKGNSSLQDQPPGMALRTTEGNKPVRRRAHVCSNPALLLHRTLRRPRLVLRPGRINTSLHYERQRLLGQDQDSDDATVVPALGAGSEECGRAEKERWRDFSWIFIPKWIFCATPTQTVEEPRLRCKECWVEMDDIARIGR